MNNSRVDILACKWVKRKDFILRDVFLYLTLIKFKVSEENEI